jgi:type IV secretory pathway VirB3-like protein
MLPVSENYSALSRPKLIAGIGMSAVAFIWPLAVIVAIEIQSIPVKIAAIALGGLAHGILAWAYKSDAHRFEVYAAYSRMGDLYQPWPSWGRSRTKTRPTGYGRESRC